MVLDVLGMSSSGPRLKRRRKESWEPTLRVGDLPGEVLMVEPTLGRRVLRVPVRVVLMLSLCLRRITLRLDPEPLFDIGLSANDPCDLIGFL